MFNETTASPSGGKPSLRIQCWFDKQKYLTASEKKAQGLPVLSRSQLNKLTVGRITHPFPEGNDMYKWNYTVYPAKTQAQPAA